MSQPTRNQHRSTRPFELRMRYLFGLFTLFFAIQAGLDAYLSNNPAFDAPSPDRSWLLSMKSDSAWVAPWLWWVRQGALAAMVLVGLVQACWGLWFWKKNERSA